MFTKLATAALAAGMTSAGWAVHQAATAVVPVQAAVPAIRPGYLSWDVLTVIATMLVTVASNAYVAGRYRQVIQQLGDDVKTKASEARVGRLEQDVAARATNDRVTGMESTFIARLDGVEHRLQEGHDTLVRGQQDIMHLITARTTTPSSSHSRLDP
jgi:outer membrane murein-binding lipoprotein Lpp